MTVLDDAERGVSHAPFRFPVRKLALVTGLACIVAHVLAQLGGSGGDAHAGPLGVVLGQSLWNAAQVGLLLLLLGLWRADRGWWVAALALATLLCLPFAVYVVSPGAFALTALLLAACGVAWARRAPDLDVSLVDAPSRGTPMLAKLELLGLACYLLSSMYNYNASRDCWPYWSSIYAGVAGLTGFTANSTEIANALYSAGLPGVTMPAWVTVGRSGNNLGAFLFVLIWTVLPVLYILYFAACAKLASKTPWTRVQQALCLFGIFHFLFLTDIVDYQYGRGIMNPAAEWCHWAERFVWRIAILLPIYQKLASGDWLRGNGRLGVVMHYGIAAWALGFLVYQVVIYDLPRLYLFATGGDDSYSYKLFGVSYRQELGYHGALVLMIALYAFMLFAMRCKRVVSVPARGV